VSVSLAVQAEPETRSRRRWLVFAVLAAVAFMAQLDLFIVNVALPEMAGSFHHATLTSLSWVLNAYAIVLAAVLVPSGRLADQFGRRRFLLWGVATFTLASVICAIAPTLPVLVLGAVCFACTGLVVSAHAKSWDVFSYFFTFWVTPMFMFSGTFFEVTRFPWFVQVIAWVLPMTHLIAVVRPVTAGLPVDPFATVGHLFYLAALASTAFWLARRRFSARLFG